MQSPRVPPLTTREPLPRAATAERIRARGHAVREPSVISTPPKWAAARTRNASLQPHFTPSVADPESGLGERHATLRELVECSAWLRGQHDPWRASRIVERNRRPRRPPRDLDPPAMHREPSRFGRIRRRFRRNDQRRIRRRVEHRRRLGPVLERQQPRPFGYQPPHATTGERRQSFDGHEERQNATVASSWCPRSTNRLAASTCDPNPDPARAARAPGSHAASRYTRNSLRNVSRIVAGMWCTRIHGGFPSTTSKPPARAASGKCAANAKGNAPPATTDLRLARSSLALARRCRHLLAFIAQRAAPAAKEVAPARSRNQRSPLGRRPAPAARRARPPARPVPGAIERAAERTLSGPRRPRITSSEQGRAGATPRERKVATRECVPATDVVVQVGKRRDTRRTRCGMVDHQRQPQSQFAQPDRRRIHVDAENRLCHHVATNHARRARITSRNAQVREPIEQVHQERTRSTRGIEHSATRHRRTKQRRFGLVTASPDSILCRIPSGRPCLTSNASNALSVTLETSDNGV